MTSLPELRRTLAKRTKEKAEWEGRLAAYSPKSRNSIRTAKAMLFLQESTISVTHVLIEQKALAIASRRRNGQTLAKLAAMHAVLILFAGQLPPELARRDKEALERIVARGRIKVPPSMRKQVGLQAPFGKPLMISLTDVQREQLKFAIMMAAEIETAN